LFPPLSGKSGRTSSSPPGPGCCAVSTAASRERRRSEDEVCRSSHAVELDLPVQCDLGCVVSRLRMRIIRNGLLSPKHVQNNPARHSSWRERDPNASSPCPTLTP
ncbi:hypothetical protein KCV05_g80, partial [Aureobasidium melanogenum]